MVESAAEAQGQPVPCVNFGELLESNFFYLFMVLGKFYFPQIVDARAICFFGLILHGQLSSVSAVRRSQLQQSNQMVVLIVFSALFPTIRNTLFCRCGF